ncbi:MAG: hypothetical protein IJI15_04220, partial [Atopobiaceae bacterium]|nr:hypothetical protein [Atopobiaceae bacterium]
MHVISLTFPEYEALAEKLGIELPVEQTEAWARFESTAEGRTPWGSVAIAEGERIIALAAFMDYQTHGYHYLRAHHAPVWAVERTDALEREVLESLISFIRSRDRRIVFVRFNIGAPHAGLVEEVLST